MFYLHKRSRTYNVFRPRTWLFLSFIILLGAIMTFIAHPPVHASTSFANDYAQAQQKHWQTGQWGSAPYYLDDQHHMYVGSGELQGSFYRAIGTDAANSVQDINIVGSVQAPENSSLLFSPTTIGQNHSLEEINGLERMDTTNVADMSNMFSNDQALQEIDLSTWYTPHLNNMGWMFLNDPSLVSANLSGLDTANVTQASSLLAGDTSLKSARVADWDTHNMQDMSYMFNGDEALTSLDLTGWQTHNALDMSYLFNDDKDLQTLSIYNFDTSDLNKNVTGMFSGDKAMYMISMGSNFRVRDEEQLPFSASFTNSPTGGYQYINPYDPDNMDEGIYATSGFNMGTWYSGDTSAADERTAKWSVVNDNESDHMPSYTPEDLPACYTTDDQGNMHIGQGELKGMNLQQIEKSTNADINKLKSIHVDYPADTSDESSHTDENEGEESDNWFSSMQDGLFANASNADYMDLRNLDVAKMTNLNQTFANDSSMDYLDISSWNTRDKAQNDMFANDDSISDLHLGNDTVLKPEANLPSGVWHNYDTGQALSSAQLTDGNPHPGHWRQPQFMKYFHEAQQKGWRTGYWGTAPWYIDNSNKMHVGSGQLQGPLYDTTGIDIAKTINGLSFDERVRAPQDSSNLLSTSYVSGDSSFLNGIDNLDNIDMSQVVDAKAMFANDTGLSGLDLSNLDTHNVTNMSYMFNDDWSMTGLNANGFDTSHVNDFESMFADNYRLQDPNIGSWDVRNVTDMDYMFWGDGDLTNLGIVNWHPDDLETMDSMFMNNKSLATMDLSHWDPTHLQNMHSAFVNNLAIHYMNLSGWQLPHIQNMESAFNGDSNMDHLDLGNADTSNANDMHSLVDKTHSLDMLTLGPQTQLKDIGYLPGVEWQDGSQTLPNRQLTDGHNHPGFWRPTQFSIDFQNAQQNGEQTGYWGTAPYYIDKNGYMKVGSGDLNGPLPSIVGYDKARVLKGLDFTEKVRAPQNSLNLLSTSFTSGDSSFLNSIDNLDNIDMSQVINAKAMFANDTGLSGLDLSHLDTHNVRNMSFMFNDDWSLTGLNANSLDTTHVNDMQSMFFNDKLLNDVQLNAWDTSSVQNMEYMFTNDTALQDLNVGAWNTNQVRSMDGMFLNDYQLQDFDISHWNTNNLLSMSGMFINDKSISYLNLSGWNSGWQVPHIQNMESAFNGASGIQHLDIGNLNTEHTNDMHFLMEGDNNIHTLDLGPATHLNDIDYLPGVEWQHGSDLANDDDLRDGNPHWGTWQQTQFSNDFQDAQQKHWDTGYWGDTPFYLDDQHNMYVGTGRLSGSLYDALGKDMARNYVRTVHFVGHAQAPQDSSFLLSTSDHSNPNDAANETSQLAHIDGEDHLDTSRVTNMTAMFADDTALQDADLNPFDTSHVQDMSEMFSQDKSLQDVQANKVATSHVTDMDHLFAADNNLANLNLGAQTTLSSSTDLRDGLWQADKDDNLGERDLTDGHSHPGDWQWVPTQYDNRNLFGTNYDSLLSLIERQYNLGNDSQNVQIMRDDHSQDTNGRLRPGDYYDIYYAINDDGIRVYHTNLDIAAYTAGDDLVGNTSQSPTDMLQSHYGSSATVDDDGGSQNGDRSMNYGDYSIRYHYQDSSGKTDYRVSKLQVFDTTQANAPYLIISDHLQDEIYNTSDLKDRLTRFWGADEKSTLEVSNVDNGHADYRLRDGDHSYTGSLQVMAAFQNDTTMNDAPGASNDSFWNGIVMNDFDNMDGIMFDHSSVDSYQVDPATGITHVRGNVYPSAGQFANGASVPYDIRIQPTTQQYTVEDTVNDLQVQDVINQLGGHPQVVSVTDGNGANVTGSFGELSTIPQDSHVRIQVKTDDGYREVDFAHISRLAEPNIDITHDAATSGPDLSSQELQGQIMSQTHESTLDNFGIDNSQMVSNEVREIDYHFTKDTTATGNGVNVTTKDDSVSGTAYVHYMNDDTATDPTFTVVQGNDAVQHIENMTGHPVRILQTTDGHDINNLPVGSYDLIYQDTDTSDGTEHHANITVTPNYYFSPVTNDTRYPSDTAGYFQPYNYQDQGNAFKSIVDTHDYSKDSQDSSNYDSSQSGDSTVDGLHTSDGKPAHFDSNYPGNE